MKKLINLMLIASVGVGITGCKSPVDTTSSTVCTDNADGVTKTITTTIVSADGKETSTVTKTTEGGSCDVASTLAAPGNVVTKSGQFKDSNTAGLSYVSGGQSGVTGADGSFIYEEGKAVTFSIGGVTIGTAAGKSVVTPVDLVAGSDSSTLEVQNIVRFLMMLDDDGDASNGLNISAAVLKIAETWGQVDFSVIDLDAELGATSIIADVSAEDGVTHILPNANTAQSHLEATLLCSYAGAYKGSYSGDDRGNFGFLLNASDGNVVGVAYSIPDASYTSLRGGEPISYDQDTTFVSGDASTGATFNGQFTSVNDVKGTWNNSIFSMAGDFSGQRIGGVSDAKYRFTGNYSGADSGLFSFDVDDSDNITGITYSVAGDKLSKVSGKVVGTTLTAVTVDGAEISGTLDVTTGELTGAWNDAVKGSVGTFLGSGCQLN